MSIRTLIEINHDYAFDDPDGLMEALLRYVASGARDDAEALRCLGMKVIGMRHHADKFVIDGLPDGFPVRHLMPAKGPHPWTV